MAATRTVIMSVLTLFEFTSSKNISFNILGGEYAKITDFPHSVFIASSRNTCGASILNQDIILTAGHCVNTLQDLNVFIAFIGHENIGQGSPHLLSNFKMHEEYDGSDSDAINDIALMILDKSLKFGKTARRVAVMARPPLETAEIAGWGRTSELDYEGSDWLKFTKQRVLLRTVCIARICNIPPGTFCASYPTGFPRHGDSGSALLVRRYIQIGIASYFIGRRSRTALVYVNVSYYLPWIRKTSQKLYCNRE